jgi:hypothetical protein
MSVERLRDPAEVRCPYCHELGSTVLLLDAGSMLIRREIDGRVFYVHMRCFNTILDEWLRKYGFKTGS